ncbi:unnamed protein product [Aphanomyces euteiches]
MNHRDEYDAEDARRLNIYISVFTVAGIVIGIILVVGAIQMRERNKRLRRSRVPMTSSRQSDEDGDGPDKASPQADAVDQAAQANDQLNGSPRSDDGAETTGIDGDSISIEVQSADDEQQPASPTLSELAKDL